MAPVHAESVDHGDSELTKAASRASNQKDQIEQHRGIGRKVGKVAWPANGHRRELAVIMRGLQVA